MNHVTFETAVRLKEAGFPQPEPEERQFWYSQQGITHVCRYIWRSTRGLMETPPRFAGIGTHDPLLGTMKWQEKYFAPTATDILPHLENILFFWGGQKWVCEQDLPFDDSSFEHENPAEAAAQLYLKLYEKTPPT